MKRLGLFALVVLAGCADRPPTYEYLLEPSYLFSRSWFDSLGAEGWELVQIYEPTPVDQFRPLAFFKRQRLPRSRRDARAEAAFLDSMAAARRAEIAFRDSVEGIRLSARQAPFLNCVSAVQDRLRGKPLKVLDDSIRAVCGRLLP